MKFTLPKRKPRLTLLFIDVDGEQYYMDERNDIVNKQGELVSLTTEANIRDILNEH